MKRIFTLIAVGALSASACDDDYAAPAPMGPDAATAAAPAEVAALPAAADESACPCWSARSLKSAFPAASFHFEDMTAAAEAGRAVLQLGDVANARVLQALVQYAPRPAGGAGDNWCQVATFGREGQEREAISALKISPEEFAACSGLLRGQAGALGVVTRAD